MSVRIINSDVMEGLAQLPDESVHCVVTSPPYWGLRDYGAAGQIGLEPTLQDHIARLVDVFREVRRVLRSDGTLWLNYGDAYCSTDKWGGGKNGNSGKQTVSDDGSVPSWAVRQRKQSQPGIKPKDLLMMPERLAIALCDDGWYVRSRIIWHKPNPMPESVTDRPTKSHEHIWLMSKSPRYFYDAEAIKERATYEGPNSPESIASPYGQGFTRRAQAVPAGWDTEPGAHGQFHKNGRASQNDDRARPPGTRPHKGIGAKGNANGFRGGCYVDGQPGKRTKRGNTKPGKNELDPSMRLRHGCNERWEQREAAGETPLSRNCRDVWTIATTPFAEAHFATFPPELAERCIKAGTSERGCCGYCGAPWERVTARVDQGYDGSRYGERAVAATGGVISGGTEKSTLGSSNGKSVGQTTTSGWRATCSCVDPGHSALCTVLDPFGGSGTTGLVADRLQRNAILIELNPEYAEMARRRLTKDAPLFAEVLP